MTTQRRMTRPGMNDNEFMTVTCTPDVTAVEFFEFQGEAEEAARENLVPSTTAYVGRVIKQGEHAVKPTASHVAILVEVDDELRRALAFIRQVKGRPSRKIIAGWLHQELQRELAIVLEVYRDQMNEEHTQPGIDMPGPKTGRFIYGMETEDAQGCATPGCRRSVTVRRHGPQPMFCYVCAPKEAP